MSQVARGSITEAVAQASPGDQIRLQPGEYYETIVADRPVTIFAETPGETVIIPPGDACGMYITADASISGIRVQSQGRRNTAVEIAGGAPNLSGLQIETSGIGLLATGSGTQPVVSNSVFQKCTIAMQASEKAHLQVEDCHVEEAVLYPLLVSKVASARVIRSRFIRAKLGGVIVMENSSAEFRACEWLGGPTADEKQRTFHAQLMILETATATVAESCRIASGSAVGVLVSGGVLTMADCTVEQNGWGGVQITQKGRAELARCQINENRGAGVIARDGSTATAQGIKVVRNQAAGIAIVGPTFAEVRGSLFLGNLCGAVLQEGARGRFEDCDMRGNNKGSFVVGPGCQREIVRVQVDG